MNVKALAISNPTPMLPMDRTGSAPDPRLSWQPSTIPALNRVHIVAASSADDDTLSAMLIRLQSSVFERKRLQQAAVPARSGGMFICLSTAVLFADEGQCPRARRGRRANDQLPSHCQAIWQIPLMYRYCADIQLSPLHTLLPWRCPFAVLSRPHAALFPPLAAFSDFVAFATSDIPSTQRPIAT